MCEDAQSMVLGYAVLAYVFLVTSGWIWDVSMSCVRVQDLICLEPRSYILFIVVAILFSFC